MNRLGNLEYKWKIFVITGLANLMCGYAINSINLALPVMAEELDADISAVSWLPLVYSVLPTCTLLLLGRRADLYGYKKQFFAGFVMFGAVSLLLPLFSRTLPVLILFRALQGVAYAVLISITQGMVSKTFPSEERGMALGVNSVFVSVGLAAGPSIGGMLLSAFSWHAIFYVIVPVSILGAAMTLKIMREDAPDKKLDRRMDWPGAAAFAGFVGALVVSVNFAGDWGIVSASFLGCMTFCGLCLAAFIVREKRTALPMMRLSLFRSRTFTLSSGACMLSYMSQQLTTFLTPFFLINILMLAENVSGMVMLATPLAMMVLSPVGGRLKDRLGTGIPAGSGLLMVGLGCFLMSRLSGGVHIASVTAALLCFGVGSGLSVPAINATIFDSVPMEYSGVASGMVATMRNLGQSLGVASGSALIAFRAAVYAGRGLPGSEAYLMAQREAFLFGVGVAAAAFCCILFASAAPRGKSSARFL